MDYFTEQLIGRKSDKKDAAVRFGITAGFTLLAVVFTLAAFMFGLPLLALTVGTFWLMYRLYGNTFVEYEYTLTNRDLDIDRIRARRKRTRLLTLDLSETLSWGPAKSLPADVQPDVTVFASDNSGEGVWFVYSSSPKLGKVLLYLTPNPRIIFGINNGVPRALHKADITEAPEE
ncbi:hypothetical protein FACS189499_03140 [Clostridia bacterium]|nr:hypothetical protein FACS189499_03140 [Clostridia bacterium]